MRSWSIPIGRYFGAEFRVHVMYVFLLAYVWFTEPLTREGLALGPGLALTLLVLGSVLAHELVKAALAAAGGQALRSVLVLPIGGLAQAEDAAGEARGPGWREARMGMTGPLVHGALAAAAATVALVAQPDAALLAPPHLHSGTLLRSFLWINLYLAALNLLPAYPLDGGRVLRAMFARHTDLGTATRRAVAISQSLALVMIFAGIWNTWLLLAGFFLFVAGQMEERMAVFQSVMENVRMEDVMLTEFATLSPGDTLEDALHKAVHSLQDDFPVIRGSDMVGVISRQKILAALRAEGNGYVQAVMTQAYEVAQRSESLGSVFRKIARRGQSIVPVVEDERLVGIVTLQNLMHSMSLLAESKRLKRAAE